MFERIWHAILPDLTVTFLTEEARDAFASGVDPSSVVFTHSFLLKPDHDKLIAWHNAKNSSINQFVERQTVERVDVLICLNREDGLALARWYIKDAGYLRTKYEDSEKVINVFNEIMKQVKPTDEELRAPRKRVNPVG